MFFFVEAPDACLREVHRALAPGGRLVVVNNDLLGRGLLLGRNSSPFPFCGRDAVVSSGGHLLQVLAIITPILVQS